MKKIILFLAAVAVMSTGYAQKKNIQSASNSLKFKEYSEAVKYIELAVNDPSTKADAKAWLLRGSIYLAMDQDTGYQQKGDYYKEVVKSYSKVMELKPDYEAQAVTSGLVYAAYRSYNIAAVANQAKKRTEAYEAAMYAVDVYNMLQGKIAENKSFDTLATNAMLIQAYSAFYNNQPDVALPILEKLKDNPIEGGPNIYLIITDLYRKKENLTKELETIEEAKAKFPKNKDIRNEELNFYIRTQQQDKLIEKLEAAVAEEPESAMYQYNLANGYTNMAFPKEEGAKRPDNYKDLIAKAEKGFLKAISLDPDNIGYSYDLAVLYFNQASKITEQMNEVTGTSAEEVKKWDELNEVRAALFAKSLPYLEKVYNTFEPKVQSLDAENKFIYQSALKAMREIYVLQDKLDKSAEMKKKMEESMKK